METPAILQSLDEYKSKTSVKGLAFLEQYGNTGIYIIFDPDYDPVNGWGGEVNGNLAKVTNADTLVKNLKEYITSALYIGSSQEFLGRCTAMRATKITSSGSHAVAKYRLSKGVESKRLKVLFIPTPDDAPKPLEALLHDYVTEQTKRHHILADISTVQGEEGTKNVSIIAMIAEATKEEAELWMMECDARLARLRFAELRSA